MTLAEYMKRNMTIYNNSELDWVHFLKDHFKEIIENHSTVEYLDPNRHNTYKYRIESYLEEMGMPKDIWWFVFYINQLSSNLDFCNLTKIRLPDCSYIQTLRTEYETVKSQRTKLRAKD